MISGIWNYGWKNIYVFVYATFCNQRRINKGLIFLRTFEKDKAIVSPTPNKQFKKIANRHYNRKAITEMKTYISVCACT